MTARLALCGLLLAACGGSAPSFAEPATYAELSDREWATLVKSPDSHAGEGYLIWACVTQFDAATGVGVFRGDASNRRLESWYSGENAVFDGEARQLEPFVEDDVVKVKVVVLGSLTYETAIGGRSTVPHFWVKSAVANGSCR